MNFYETFLLYKPVKKELLRHITCSFDFVLEYRLRNGPDQIRLENLDLDPEMFALQSRSQPKY